MGLILLAASVPILVVNDATLEEVATILVSSASLVTGGFYAILTASRALESEQ
nr:hypothetical protein [Candidatus Njordarchaeota archaeon]